MRHELFFFGSALRKESGLVTSFEMEKDVAMMETESSLSNRFRRMDFRSDACVAPTSNGSPTLGVWNPTEPRRMEQAATAEERRGTAIDLGSDVAPEEEARILKRGKDATRTRVAVLLPVWNAMPYLGDSVGDVLAQVGVEVELLAVDDMSQDGSREYLERLVELQHLVACDDKEEDKAREEWEACLKEKGCMRRLDAAPRPEDVLARRRPGNHISILFSEQKGHGHALNAALDAAQAEYVGHMEADDLCPPDRFLKLLQWMQRDTKLDASCSQIDLVGHRTEGMTRYVEWQNGLLTNEQMSKARFLEIPALHQSGLYKRSVLRQLEGYREPQHWPVDIDFWNRWYEKGLRAGKVPEALYFWRQHEAQSTRTQRKNSLPNLQKCKVHYFCRPRGPGYGKCIQLWGRGETLKHIGTLMEEAGIQHERIEWKPGWSVPTSSTQLAHSRTQPTVRVFLFGSCKPRARIMREFPDFDAENDWFLS